MILSESQLRKKVRTILRELLGAKSKRSLTQTMLGGVGDPGYGPEGIDDFYDAEYGMYGDDYGDYGDDGGDGDGGE